MKNLNGKIQRYLELKDMIKEMEAEMETLKESFIDMGDLETNAYSIKITEQSRQYLAGIEAVALVVGKDVLEKNQLIKTSVYPVVKVSQKSRKAA